MQPLCPTCLHPLELRASVTPVLGAVYGQMRVQLLTRCTHGECRDEGIAEGEASRFSRQTPPLRVRDRHELRSDTAGGMRRAAGGGDSQEKHADLARKDQP